MNARLALAAMLLLAASCADAQSPFAVTGLGQNVETGSACDTGRGGRNTADSDTPTPGARNPAALADLRFAGIIFSGFGESTDSEGGDEERTTTRTMLPNVRLAIPLRKARLILHAGFNVKRSMQWETRTEFELEHFGEPVSGYERKNREGTLYQIPVGLAWRPMDGLALGATLNFVRGSVNNAVTQVFTDPLNTYYLSNTSTRRDELGGTSVTMSALWDGLRFVHLGASFTPGYDLAMDRELSLGGVGARTYDHFDLTMPDEYRAGVMVRLPADWRVGVDGQMARYGELTGYPDWESVMNDEWTVSAGFERPGEFAAHSRGYRMPLRFGYQMRRTAQTMGGADVDEQMISVGTGIPFRNRLGRIDFSLSYLWAGNAADNGVESKSLRLGVSIIGLEPLVF